MGQDIYPREHGHQDRVLAPGKTIGQGRKLYSVRRHAIDYPGFLYTKVRSLEPVCLVGNTNIGVLDQRPGTDDVQPGKMIDITA